jgi:hypothetical protein
LRLECTEKAILLFIVGSWLIAILGGGKGAGDLLYQVVHYNLKPNIDKIQKKEFYFILFSFSREREREPN